MHKGGEIKSRIGTFPKVSTMANTGAKSVESRSKPWAGWRMASVFGDDRSMFAVKELFTVHVEHVIAVNEFN